MRRSTFVYAPILAAAALALPTGHRAAAQQPAATTQQANATTREGFGASFREHPWEWLFGASWTGFIIYSAAS